MKPNANLNIDRYTWARETIKKIATATSGAKLFDIGSRDEIFHKYCADLPVTYFGFDRQPLTANIRQWDIENRFPYEDGQADIITFLEVVEHLNNPWISIKNLADTLKPKGYLLLTTPNPAWSNARINLLMKGQLSCFTDNDLDVNHHVFTPWPHIIKKLLSDNGFSIANYVTLDGKTRIFAKPLSPLKFPVQIGFRLTKKLIELSNNGACGMSYAILAQKD